MTTRYVILGLLAQGPMSGYDIKGVFKGLAWMIGAPSYGTLYPTLHALLEEGLVSMDVEPGQGTPPRKLYTLTQAGHDALREWLKDAAALELSIKTFARQLILADSLSPDELRDHLVRRRTQVGRYAEVGSGAQVGRNVTVGHDDSEEEFGPKEDRELALTLGRRMVNDYGLAIARAELAWLNAQLAKLT